MEVKKKIITSSKIWDNENSRFLLLLLILAFLIYFTPPIISKIGFLLILPIAFRSKRDYFFIALLFILIEKPGGFFYGALRNDPSRTPLFTITAGFSIAFEELMILMLFIKVFFKKRKNFIILKKEINIIFIYLLFLGVYSFVLGMSERSIVQTIRFLMPWGLLIALPKLMTSEEDFIKLCKLLFPFIFFALFSQFYEMKTGMQLVSLVKKNYLFVSTAHKLNLTSEYAARAIDSSFLIFFSFFIAFIFIKRQKKVFPDFYLILIISSSVLAIIMSATRGWIIAFLFMVVFGVITGGKIKKLIKIFSFSIVGVLITFLLVRSSSLYKIQFERSLTRFETIEDMMRGDLTAGGTLKRIDVRSPRVMKKFWQSPFLGWGFSDDFYNFQDMHVGNQTLLLNVGIVGFILILIFIVKLNFLVIKYRRLNKKNNNVESLSFIPVAFFGYFIIHSSSLQMIGFAIPINITLLFCLLFTFTNIISNNLIKSFELNKKISI